MTWIFACSEKISSAAATGCDGIANTWCASRSPALAMTGAHSSNAAVTPRATCLNRSTLLGTFFISTPSCSSCAVETGETRNLEIASLAVLKHHAIPLGIALHDGEYDLHAFQPVLDTVVEHGAGEF